eukprot:1210322-Ditylum_brightwellii.AAC.1
MKQTEHSPSTLSSTSSITMPSVLSHGTTPTSNPTAVNPSPDQFSAVNDLSPVTKEEKEEEEYFQNAMIHGWKLKFMVVPATSD